MTFTRIEVSVGEAETSRPSSGHQAILITGQCPGWVSVWTALDQRWVAIDNGSIFQIRTQLWHATAKIDEDNGLKSKKIWSQSWLPNCGAKWLQLLMNSLLQSPMLNKPKIIWTSNCTDNYWQILLQSLNPFNGRDGWDTSTLSAIILAQSLGHIQ